jgi:hypothetical protein
MVFLNTVKDIKGIFKERKVKIVNILNGKENSKYTNYNINNTSERDRY